MSTEVPATALQLRSLVRADQTVELFLETVEVPQPGTGEVLVRIEASPINPSDLGLLLAGADVSAAVWSGSGDRPVVTAPLPEAGQARTAWCSHWSRPRRRAAHGPRPCCTRSPVSMGPDQSRLW